MAGRGDRVEVGEWPVTWGLFGRVLKYFKPVLN